ncbi:hypothetical protein Ancab_024604 [Ancistrocladus abbreviatus]
MESLLGFKETTSTLDEKSYGHKLVPWLNWDEWDSVRVSLFSSSADSIASALRRISAWRSRGCLPVVIEVTASVIEIQQKDPYFREDLSNGGSESEEMLGMLYSMSIMRLVNCVIEKTRKKTVVSIAEAAEAMNIPRMLIDIRHEGSHRDLPSLRLLRLASRKALNWLKVYYWDPQMEAIPFHRAKAANIRKEIKSRLHELASCLKGKSRSGLSSSHIKGKRGENLSLSRYDAEVQKIGVLSSLFSWLVEILKELKPLHSEGPDNEISTSSALPKATLVELLRRCVLVSKPGNNQLLRSALLLAQMTGGSSLIEKLNKLSMLLSSNFDSDNSLDISEKFMHEENHIDQAVQKLRSIKLQRVKNASGLGMRSGNLETKNRWTIAESWNPCPIGMLPRTLGSSGRLPVLDYIDEQTKAPSSIERQENTQNSSGGEENLELRKCSGKQEACCDPDVLPLKNSSLKRLRETTEACEVDDMDIVSSPHEPEGRLLIGGVWRKVGEKELQEIQSAIRVLI